MCKLSPTKLICKFFPKVLRPFFSDGFLPAVCNKCNKQDVVEIIRSHSIQCQPLPLICTVCDNEQTDDGAMRIHYLHDHTDNKVLATAYRPRRPPKETAFECRTCHEVFKSRGALVAHMKIHQPETTYMCAVCSFTCNKNGKLNAHMKRYHSSKEDLTCKVCNMEFTMPGGLKNHLKLKHPPDDSSLKQYPCGKCDKTFADPRYLDAHVKRVHERILRYFCKECGKGFYEKIQVQRHE